jgi:hypothetical protein
VPEKTLPFRLYAQILIFSALVALGALILWPLQHYLYGGMVGIRDNVLSRFESHIGRKIRYSSISPSLFGSFDVRNVSIMGHDNIPLLTMSRFRITYSLLDIIRGRNLAINTVQLDSPLIYYNTAADNDLLNLFKTAGQEQEASFQELFNMLPEKITIRIRNGRCRVLSGNNNFELDALNFNAGVFAKSVVLDGRWNLNFTISKLTGDPVNFQIAMTANGLCQMDIDDGEAVINISSITGDVSSVEQIVFNVIMRDGGVSIRKKPDAFPFNVALDYGKEGKNLEGRLSCDGLMPARLVSFSGGLESAGLLLDAAVSGEALFESDNDGSFGYSVNFAASTPLDLSRQEAAKAVAFEINITGDQKLARIERLHFSMPITQNAFFCGGAGFTGAVAFEPFAPDGTLFLDNFSISGREGVSAEIKVNTDGPRINLLCDTLDIGGGVVDIAAFNASLEQSENKMGFSVSGKRAAVNASAFASAFASVAANADIKEYFSLDGSIDTVGANLDANILLNSFSIGDLAGLAAPFLKEPPMPDMLLNLIGDTEITTELFLSTDFKQLSYNAPSLAFSGNSGDRGFSGYASINGTDGRFELSNGQINHGGDVLLLSAQADFEAGNDIGFSINTVYNDLEYFIKGEALDGKTVNIQGSYGLNVNLAASGNKTYSGVIHTENFPIPFLGKPALLSLEARLRRDSPQIWSMDFSRVELTDIISPAGKAQFSAQGRADQNGINFPKLYYKDGIGPISGSANFQWPKNSSGINGVVSMADDRENYMIEASYSDSRLNLGFSGLSIRMDRFSDRAKNIRMDAEMRLLWDSSGSFNADINLSSLRGKLYEQEFNLNAQAAINNEELTVKRIAIGYEYINGEIPQFVINGKNGTVWANGDLKFFANGKLTEGGLTLKANFKPVKSWLKFNEALEYFAGKMHVEEFRYGNGSEPQTFDIDFSRAVNGSATNGAAFIVSGGPRNMLRLRVDDNGNFYAGLSSPSPVRGTAIGNISGNTINASCNDLYVDMEGLFNLLPKKKDIFLTGGYVNASVDIRGSLSDPEFFGQARGTSLRLMIPSYIPVELRPIPFNVAIEGNEIRFGPVQAAVGKGAGSVSGHFLIARWIPNIFDIDITVPRETPIPYSLDLTGFTAGGDTSGKLNISMENTILNVSGDLYVNNTMLGINSEDINKAHGQALFSDSAVNSVVNITISTGPVVEFIYPDSRFPILRANPDMGTKLHVKADTLKGQFSLASDIKIRGGEIFYFERSFYIRSGLLVFKENELHFAPRLTARAEVRDRNDDGPVTISMIVDNAPLMDFTARFESSPPLSQMEILALMGQSITGAQPGEDTVAYQKLFINSTTDILAQFFLVRRVERQIRNFLQLDMFSFRTQVLQNVLFRTTGLMQQPVDRTGEVGNYFDNTTLFGGKYIGQDMFVQGMLSMRYDANRNTFGGMIFQPDFGLELQGAMFSNTNFRIRWDFVPEHPENWYANDNSITLTFSRSF